MTLALFMPTVLNDHFIALKLITVLFRAVSEQSLKINTAKTKHLHSWKVHDHWMILGAEMSEMEEDLWKNLFVVSHCSCHSLSLTLGGATVSRSCRSGVRLTWWLEEVPATTCPSSILPGKACMVWSCRRNLHQNLSFLLWIFLMKLSLVMFYRWHTSSVIQHVKSLLW